jgi:hypothetical protein
MKLAMVFFLCLLPLNREVWKSAEKQFPGNASFSKYIAMEQDITRVALEFQRHLILSKQMNRPFDEVDRINSPAIRRHTLTPWNYKNFPVREDKRGDRPQAILPKRISLTDVKKD